MTKTRNRFLGLFALAAGALSLGAASVADAHPGHASQPTPKQLYSVSAYAPATVAVNDEVPTPIVPNKVVIRDHRSKRVAMADRPGQTNKRAKRAKARAMRKQAKQNRRAKVLEQYDTNRNGTLEAGEKVALRRDRFSKLDLNNDGQVTKQELQAKMKERKEKIHARRKANGKANKPLPPRAKQKLAKRRAKVAKRFNKLDADNSGSISWEEFKTPPKRDRKGKRNKRRQMRRDHRMNKNYQM